VSKQKLFIGISGKMCVGKSTISKLLLQALPNSGRGSMASPIYKAQDILYKEYDIQLEGDKDRDLLIAIGMWGRSKSPDFWLEQFVKESVQSDYDIIICDDVRFPNEADLFAKHGILIRIEGEQRGDNVDHSRSQNATETSLDDYKFEHVINNSLSPEDICLRIGEIMQGK
tara:strand:+ start:1075 stop:1587 length:513 start_codon:yes stop_codon:yes gene_type:complete